MRKIMAMRTAFGCLIIVAVLCGTGVFAGTLVLNTAEEYPLSTADGRGIEDLIISEAFRRVGVSVEIAHLPAERALVNANKGIDDGTFVRIAGIERIYPNLVRVRERITEFEFVAFAREPSIKIRDWNSLRPYSIGIITGWKILEAKIVGASLLTKVSSPEALFSLLERGRADIVVYDRTQGIAMMRKLGIAGVRPLSPPLAKQDMFLYLNRRHEDLAPKLESSLREMKRDGSFSRISGPVGKERE
jgi:polar amino acid transport system substrate-binding protein